MVQGVKVKSGHFESKVYFGSKHHFGSNSILDHKIGSKSINE